MYPLGHSLERHARAGRWDGRIALWFALFMLALAAPGVFAQTVTHVTNPFAGATFYVNPDWTAEVQTATAGQSATVAAQMKVVGTYPTAVWMDHIAAIAGGNGRVSLQQHVTQALAQQAASGSNQPIVVELVIYDLPDRDCAALASNGELSIAGGDTIQTANGPVTLTGTGLQEYQNDYLTPIANVFQTVANNPNIRFVLVVEDDSLPNLITNVGQAPNPAIAACVAANGGVSGQPNLNSPYVQAIQAALNTFHKFPNVYNYLDVGHHGWLGWSNNFQPAVDFLTAVAKGTTAGIPSVDGFITNTANYGPTTEPFMTANEMIGGNPVRGATFYHFNQFIDELSYASAMDDAFVKAGFPSTVGFLIDTSRNGWGSTTTRPKGPSTSTVLDTFVNQSKIDARNDMGQWCNQPNAGMGTPPTVNPGGFANLQAFVWIKPPGESDGNYPGSVFNGVTSTVGDPNCNPTHSNSLANNTLSGAVPNSPKAGTFWASYFTMLVNNAFPPISASTIPSFTVSSTGVSVLQGQTATTSVTISAINGFSGAVTLSATGLPAGVTASFSPSMVTGSAGSTLTLTAAGNAAVGPATVTITGSSTGTGTSGATSASTPITVTVVAKPDFTMTGPTGTVNVNAGSTATAPVAIAFVGGLTGSVAVQAAGLPAGVSANFAPNSVNANGTITVSFFAQPGTANTSANVTITGTNGQGTTAITHTITIPLTVGGGGGNIGNPSFTLTPAATSLSVAANGSGTDTITVGDAGGFAGPVTLTAAGAPAGVTVTFGTNPATTSSVVTVTAGSMAASGSFMLTISGSGTSAAGTALTASTTIAVTIGNGNPPPPAGACHIGYTITNQWTPGFQVSLSIDNTSTTAINGWTLGWTFPSGQSVTQLWNGAETQSGSTLTVTNLNYNASIPAGGSYKDAGFTGTWSGTNGIPTAFTLNGATCTVN